MEQLVYPNDLWTLTIEDLGFDRLAKQIVSMSANSKPPFAVGVFGKWGSGKTSLLRYSMARLGGQPITVLNKTLLELQPEISRHDYNLWENLKDNTITHINYIRCVWFNPWQYQNEPNLLIPLLHEIRSQMSLWIKFKDKVNKLFRVSVESGISMLGQLSDEALKLGLGIPASLGKMVDKIRATGERYERQYLETTTDSQRFALLFEDAVNKLLGTDKINENDDPELIRKKRLIIFIDDLDRCDDSQVLSLLETIKLYLCTPYCVFVFGMDVTAVERALFRSWQEKKSILEVREYLEKLFQGVVHVPTSQNYSVFIEKQLTERGIIPKDNTKTDFVHNLSQLLEPNPRKIKNFLTAIQGFYASLEDKIRKSQHFDFSHVALLTYLKLLFPDVYRTIEYDTDNFLILFNVFDDWKTTVRLGGQIAAFYAKSFSHVLEMEAIAEGSEIASMEEGYKRIKDYIDRHKGDKKFVELFKTRFNDFTDREHDNFKYLTGLIRTAIPVPKVSR